MQQPFFSIIIPVYNIEDYIGRCLQSCIEQTFKNIEIIVLHNCGQISCLKKQIGSLRIQFRWQFLIKILLYLISLGGIKK